MSHRAFLSHTHVPKLSVFFSTEKRNLFEFPLPEEEGVYLTPDKGEYTARSRPPPPSRLLRTKSRSESDETKAVEMISSSAEILQSQISGG